MCVCVCVKSRTEGRVVPAAKLFQSSSLYDLVLPKAEPNRHISRSVKGRREKERKRERKRVAKKKKTKYQLQTRTQHWTTPLHRNCKVRQELSDRVTMRTREMEREEENRGLGERMRERGERCF